MLTPSLRDFHDRALNQHMDLFEDMSTGEYAATFSDDNVDIDTLDERASLAVFYRCSPYTGQDTMMVSINPGIVSSIEPGSEGAMHAAIGRDYDAKTTLSMHYILLYLLGEQTNNHARTPRLFSRLAAESTGRRFTEADATNSYFQRDAAAGWKAAAEEIDPSDFTDWLTRNPDRGADPSTGFLSEVYYSVAYKLATANANSAKAELARELLPEEIELADPSLILSCGSLPWETLYAEYGDALTPVQEGEVPAKVSEAAGNVFKAPIGGETRYIAVLKHMAMMENANQGHVAKTLAKEGLI